MASSTTYENTAGGSTKLLYNDTSVNDYIVELPKKNAVLASTNEANFSYKPTPISIISWSYVTTTITLNVASHTFVAGDYIEVGGLTATTNIPNGIHLVTSVTATTIVFTYALTPTGTAGVSSATAKGYMTTNGRVEGIGVGQTWRDMSASRVSGVTYINTLDKPIYVQVFAGSNSAFTYTVGGITRGYSTSAVSSAYQSIVFIVPNFVTYSAQYTTGTANWLELR